MFMDRILAEDKNVIFMVSSLSRQILPSKITKSFKEYAGTFPTSPPFLLTVKFLAKNSCLYQQITMFIHCHFRFIEGEDWLMKVRLPTFFRLLLVDVCLEA